MARYVRCHLVSVRFICCLMLCIPHTECDKAMSHCCHTVFTVELFTVQWGSEAGGLGWRAKQSLETQRREYFPEIATEASWPNENHRIRHADGWFTVAVQHLNAPFGRILVQGSQMLITDFSSSVEWNVMIGTVFAYTTCVGFEEELWLAGDVDTFEHSALHLLSAGTVYN